jgi:3-deoxy-D-manno-octulosonate 8-phosphate phosphatase (KDO 8-P phosphatase)
MDSVLERAADVRLLVLDVDGVLTDGRLHFTARGEEFKSFHVRDGAGIKQLIHNGVQVAVISGRESKAVERRMAELNVTWVRQGVDNKGAVLQELLDILGLGPQAVGAIGDDIPELPLFEVARLAVAVADAHEHARAAAHYVTRAIGGNGAVREVCDLILAARTRGAP